MKKCLVILAILLAGFLFPHNVFANCTASYMQPHTLPFIDTQGNQYTFDALFADCSGSYWTYTYYEKSALDYVYTNSAPQHVFHIQNHSRVFYGDFYTSEFTGNNDWDFSDVINYKTSENLYNQMRDTILYYSNIGGGPTLYNFPLSGSLENRTILLEFGDDWTFGECPTNVYKKHAGVDLSATADESVYAAHSGTVKAIYTGQHSQWADAIIIEDDNEEFTTVYWHVNPYGGLSVNDNVTKGQQVATVADLGSNTHFHFGIRMSGYDANLALAGALPVESCGTSPTYPAFPESFIDPSTLTYE